MATAVKEAPAPAARQGTPLVEMRDISIAFGGIKASGRAREGGVWGLEEFMDSKQISGWDLDA